MTLIEKMARAAYEVNPLIGTTWDQIAEVLRQRFVQAQRAALAAAREPTEAMMSAGADAVSTLFDPGAKAVWQAMVDAALEEGK